MGEKPVRKSYHNTRVMWDGGVISDRARFCHEFGVNPDVEELERYNVQGQSRECDHAKLEFVDTGERTFYVCRGCDLSDPNWRDKFVTCQNCVYRSSYARDKCRTCDDLRLIRKTS